MTVKTSHIARVALTSLIVVGLAACSSIQARNSATGTLSNTTTNQAFDLVTLAAENAGIRVISSNKLAGRITATRVSNGTLSWKQQAMNIAVRGSGSDVIIKIDSTVSGQLVDYGITAGTIDDFCAALIGLRETATCVRD